MQSAYLYLQLKLNNYLRTSVVEAGSVKIYTLCDKPSVIKRDIESTAEDLCISLCNKYSIPPLTRTLFALRIRGTNLFLKDNSKVLQGSREYEFRIRFKVPDITQLRKLSEETFDYYFQQARNDVNENKIPDLKYPEHEKELLGLGITDMIRAVLEDNLRVQDVINDYARYIPVVLLERGKQCKEVAARDLPKHVRKLSGFKSGYVKTQYLQQLYALAPNYLVEEYDDVIWENGENNIPVQLVVSPFHPQEAGIRLYNTIDRKWSVVCSIENLIYLTRYENFKEDEKNRHKLEVSRGKTSVFFFFKSKEQLSSFISVCNGYYRLMAKWTFNLSKDDETPSLKELQKLKCHGPVGVEFAHRKLQEKAAGKQGSFILRECEKMYNVYFLDFCTDSGTTDIRKIVFDGEYKFLEMGYKDLNALIDSYNDKSKGIYLNKDYFIMPSEYDKSQLLLCAQPKIYLSGEQVSQAELPKILLVKNTPYFLSANDITNKEDLIQGTATFRTGSLTETRKAEWTLDETNKKKSIFVALKELKQDMADNDLKKGEAFIGNKLVLNSSCRRTSMVIKEFIELANKWSRMQSSSIVRLYGVILECTPALVLEYICEGRFDKHLKENKADVTLLHLKKVAVGLARALWDLSEAGVVHGFIRCERLLLSVQDGDRLVVKLTGPSVRKYTPQDVHWIPVAFFDDFEQAKRSVVGDIWAFATTLWEIFSYGQSPGEPPTSPILTQSSYKNNDRLMRPENCPDEVWTIITKCWQPNPPCPQEILRDLNHMLHNDYIPVNNNNDDVQINQNTETNVGSSCIVVALASDNNGCSENSLSHRISYNKNRPLGKGKHGSVYKGVMWNENQQTKQRRDVAVKVLQGENNSHRNELEIMRQLAHTNIVQILGYSSDQYNRLLVMEYFEERCLYNYLKFKTKNVCISQFIKFAEDIARGMEHVSAQNICHCDLATRNVLVVDNHNVKISDFGLARFNRGAGDVQLERAMPRAISLWYPPESVRYPHIFTTESDVWAYGVTVWEIFTRAQDVPDYSSSASREERASVFTLPEGCPQDIYRSLMKDCWELEPSTFSALVKTCEDLALTYRVDLKNN